ncbi:MAG TPA: CHASE domain-containing protein [Thermoanaerobaculia bacterium]|jgi:PAS domain S-box-containing protein|nr:CHASE domain-containing protein [Thermoanaerobaculia bacterium]
MTLPWRQYGRLSVILPVAATLVSSVLLFGYARRQEDVAVLRTFQDRARTLASAVRVSCDSHLEILISLNALYSTVPAVSREEFSRFVAKSLSRHPGIRGLSWNPRVEAADRARFEAEAGAPITERDPHGQRVPAEPRDEYVVVRYVEPATDQRALGLDVASEPVRREALSNARETGLMAATRPIRLVNDRADQLSILVFAPVYGTGRVPATVEERRRRIRGYTTGAFRLEDLVETAIRDLPRGDVAVALFEDRDPAPPERLYSDARWASRRDEAAGGLGWREPFVFGGRRWEVRVAATRVFQERYRSWYSWLILLGGLLFAGLLGAFLYVVTSRTAKAEELMVRRTADAQVSEARTRDILEHMLGGMITFNEQSRIESVNPAAQRIVGYREEELIGQSLAVLMPDAPADDPLPYLRQVHQKAIGRVTETWGRRKNGEVFYTEAALFEFAAPEGRRFACNFQDISERREVDRLKSEFVSTVSHELRTPLTSIRGSLGLLAGGVLGDLSPQVRDLLLLAERNAVRLTALINDILDFERLDSGRIEMQCADVDLQALFEQSLESVRPVADQQQIALLSSPTELRLRADGARIVQLLINLVSNAIKFSPPGREIRVWAEEKDDDWVRVFVKDRGQGIPASYHQRIFERFVHVETADKRDKKGTGLGLAICKAIVEQHGGRIGVDSEPGVGSTFWFDLPGAAGQEAMSERPN